jgi:hypothetical protein
MGQEKYSQTIIYKVILIIPPSHRFSKIKKGFNNDNVDTELPYPILNKLSTKFSYNQHNIELNISQIHANTNKQYLKDPDIWKGASAIIYCYDINRKATKEEILRFESTLRSVQSKNNLFRFVVAENSYDKITEADIQAEEITWKNKSKMIFLDAVRDKKVADDILMKIGQHIFDKLEFKITSLLKFSWGSYFLIFILFLYYIYRSFSFYTEDDNRDS